MVTEGSVGSVGSNFVSGKQSASQVYQARIYFRAPDRFALEVSPTSSPMAVELELKFKVPRINKTVSCSMLYLLDESLKLKLNGRNIIHLLGGQAHHYRAIKRWKFYC